MKLDVYTYEFPFTQPFATAAGTFSDRKGLYLKLRKDGITAWGEAAPLPGFSEEDLSDLIYQLQNRRGEINEVFSSSFSPEKIQSWLHSAQLYPSLEFAVYMLASTWLAQHREQALHNFLFDSPRYAHSNAVQINAVLGLKEEDPLQRIDEIIKQGFGTIKLKADPNTDTLFSLLQKIREKYPQLSIRIDANRSWSPEEAAGSLKRIENYSIEYCEEPLAAPEPSAIQKLSRLTSVPIALDESLAGTFSLHEAAEIASVLILKPAILGAPAFPEFVNELIESNSIKVVFTTSLESGIGRLMTASLAAGLGSSDFAHGLGTGHLLKKDIWSDSRFISKGTFHLPNAQELAALMNRSAINLPIEEIS